VRAKQPAPRLTASDEASVGGSGGGGASKMIRRASPWILVVAAASALLSLGPPGVARAQSSESIDRYDVAIRIARDGSLSITETIDYDFGSAAHHGIFRDIPTTLRYDGTNDRVYPLHVVSVTATGGAPAGYTVSGIADGKTEIKIGDPDRTVTGDHVYTIVYTVGAAMNGFAEHDELYWNAIGTDWAVPIQHVNVHVSAPGPVSKVACFSGPGSSSFPCERAKASSDGATFSESALAPYEGMTVVVALPKGVVAAPVPQLRERWALSRAFSLTPWTMTGSGLLLVLIVGALAALLWRRGRDRRYRGSPVDQVMGNPTGEEQAVPLFEADASAPVEFAPPEGLRPGQVGTVVDEQANVLDVSATIVDLAVRGFLTIHEIPKEGWFGKADWSLQKTEATMEGLLEYERALLNGLFRDGSEVKVSALKTTFVERLKSVQEGLYDDAVGRGWFATRPDKIRQVWKGRGVVLIVAGAALTYALARWTHWGLLGLPVVLGGLLLSLEAHRMPARTAKGTAILRRVRGFRTVIEKAEANMARWAEQENVFTRYLPYAIVFGCTDKWARAFAGIGLPPDTTWYVGSQPFTYLAFADSMDHFAVTTSGTIASTPSGSGGSGFSGGFSGGGGGGGGGGSW
jgi:uncharacterized membrane protein YgcG